MKDDATNSLDRRLSELEITVSFQTREIETLSEVIATHQRDIDTLRLEIERLRTQLLAQDAEATPQEKPPHY